MDNNSRSRESDVGHTDGNVPIYNLWAVGNRSLKSLLTTLERKWTDEERNTYLEDS